MKQSQKTKQKKKTLFQKLITPRGTPRKTKRFMLNKLVIVYGLISLALFALAVYLVFLIRGTNSEYSVEVLSRHGYTSSAIQARRGDIVDRNGTKIATSEPYYILVLDPKVILYSDKYVDKTIQTLAEYFELDETELRTAIEENAESSYLRYGGKTLLTYDQVSAFEKYQELWNAGKYKYETSQGESVSMTKEEKETKIKGVWFEIEYQRNYPFADLGSKVIGFTTNDGADGLWGLENYYNSELTGENGRVLGYLDEDYDLEQMVYPATDGNTIVSTIDITAQKIIQENIAGFMEQVGGKQVGVVLMNPKNGEILAMATNTEYDLNNPTDLSGYYTEEELAAMSEEERLDALNQMWRNMCISDSYEPGSTAKLITASAGLEEGVLSVDDTYYCDGGEVKGGWQIHCAHVHDTETFIQAVANSCNDALMKMVDTMGAEMLSKYLHIFNFAQSTGIDLGGEATCEGLLYSADQLHESELATYSFGQGYNVTMIQQAAAIASIVNGGYYYQPHLVKEIRNSDGVAVETKKPVLVRQTISQQTSDTMREAMKQVVESGTGTSARIAGYNMGGKTGAAQKIPRSSGKFIVSFISCIDIDNPDLMLYVIIDEPNVEDQSSSGIAQIFAREIWTDLIPYYNIFPDESLLKEGEAVGTTNDSPYVSDSFEIPGYIIVSDPDATGYDPDLHQPEEGNPEAEIPEEVNPEENPEDNPAENPEAEQPPAGEGQPVDQGQGEGEQAPE